jgi:KipI family sensor histidine kinase inhibitor
LTPDMIQFPAPCSALITLPVRPDRGGIAYVLDLERRVTEVWEEPIQTIPAFNRLLISGSPAQWDHDAIVATLKNLIKETLGHRRELTGTEVIELPACYAPELAPDLVQVAEAVRLSSREVTDIHASRTYTVLATGFAPGFAYLGDVDPRIAHPRRDEPRRRVPVGALGLADRRTGIYPSAGPGGWQLIARVPEPLFENAADRLARFEPGAQVRFRPVSLADFLSES